MSHYSILNRFLLLRLVLLAVALVLVAFSSRPVSSSVAEEVVATTTDGDITVGDDSNNLTHLAFGSCYKLKYAKSRHPNVFESILKTAKTKTKTNPLQAWLWTGDAIYPPSKGIAPVAELELEYVQMKHSPDYAAFVEQVPFIGGTYDDHDYGGNDQGRHIPDKQERARLFWDFLGLLDRRPQQQQHNHREGVYYSVNWGKPPLHQVKLIFLDTRYFRDNHCLIPSIATKMPVLGAGFAALIRWMIACLVPTSWCDTSSQRTILGETQWTWLEQELESSQASVHIVVSSIQVLTTNPAMESWGQFPSEQRRLLKLLHKARTKSLVVLLSGDVHHGEILNASNGSIIEVTSSGLTHDCSSPVYGFLCKPLLQTFAQNRQSPDSFYTGRNFGTILLDWEKRALLVKVHALKDENEKENDPAATTIHNHNKNKNNDKDDSEEDYAKPVLSTGWIPFAFPASPPDAAEDADGDADDSTTTTTTTVGPPASLDFAPCMDGHLRPVLGTVIVVLVSTSALVALVRRRQNRS